MQKLVSGAVLAAALAVASSANAADLARPVYKAPVIAPVYNWTGWYFGGNVGGAWNNSSVNHSATPGPCDPTFPGCTSAVTYGVTAANAATFGDNLGNGTHFIGGVQLGYNYQWSSPVVVGFEADIQWLSNKDRTLSVVQTVENPFFANQGVTYSGVVSARTDYLGTVRARLGYAFVPTVLAYATGGLAYGGVHTSGFDSLSTANQGQVVAGSAFSDASKTRFGFTVGGGFEWAFAQNWTVKAEYLYVDLGSVSYDTTVVQNVAGNPGIPFGGANIHNSVDVKENIVRAGLNYRF